MLRCLMTPSAALLSPEWMHVIEHIQAFFLHYYQSYRCNITYHVTYSGETVRDNILGDGALTHQKNTKYKPSNAAKHYRQVGSG